MSKVMTFSRVFPSYHPRAGEPTYFVEKIWESLGDCFYDQVSRQLTEVVNFDTMPLSTKSFDPKHHTIRAGHRWKVGDKFSPRVWSGQPYKSKQIIIAPDIEVKKVWTFDVVKDGDYVMAAIDRWPFYEENKDFVTNVEGFETLAKNDGLSVPDLKAWFKWPKPTGEMQIICWNESINY